MKQWWQQNSKVDLGSYTQNEVEDLTGSIPLLLDSCVVDGKIDLSVEALHNIFDQVQQFMSDIKGTRSGADLRRHCDHVTACISHQPVRGSTPPELVDHRYFYAEC